MIRPGALLMMAVAGLTLFGCSMQTVSDLNQLGLVEYRAGNYAHAKAYFEKAWEKDRERAVTLYNLGSCAMAMAAERQGKGSTVSAMRYLDEAVYWFDQAIASFPGYTEAQHGKVRALELQGKYRQATAVATWADQTVGPAARQKWVLARHHERRGDMDEALLGFRQAAAMEPRSAYAQAELGRFHLRRGQRDEAIMAFRRAYALNPTEGGVASALAEFGALPVGQPDR